MHRGLIGGTWRRESIIGDFEEKVRFYFYQETLNIRDSEIYVKVSSGNGDLSP